MNVKTFLIVERSRCAEIQEYLTWGDSSEKAQGYQSYRKSQGWSITGTGMEFVSGKNQQQPLIEIRYTFIPLGQHARVEIEARREPVSRLPLVGEWQMRVLEKREREWLRSIVDNARVAVAEVRRREKAADGPHVEMVFEYLSHWGQERGLKIE